MDNGTNQLAYYTRLILLLLVISVYAASGCSISMPHSQFEKKNEKVTLTDHKSETNINANITSTITTTQWIATQLKLPIEVRRIDFISAELGYISDSRKSLYKTADGGKAWEQLNVPIPDGLEISSLSFLDATLGWVSLRSAPSEDERPHKQLERYPPITTWLMQTRDGGSNWEMMPSEMPLIINNVQFVNEREGWAWGIKIYHTNDQGKHWIDTTENLCRMSPHDNIYNCIFYSIHGQVSGQLTVLTNDLIVGGLVTSTNSGKSWQLITKVKLSPFGYTEPVRIKYAGDKSLWLVASSDSKEGMWGELIHIQPDESVIHFNFGNVITDLIFLSNNRLLACGYVYLDEIHRGSGKRTGIILSSSDGGHTWETIYRNSKIEGINAMEVIDSRDVWAIGSGGEIVKLEYKENK